MLESLAAKGMRRQERGSTPIATHRGVEGSRLRRFPGSVARVEQCRRTESPYSGIAPSSVSRPFMCT